MFASTPVMVWGRLDSLKGSPFKLNVGFEGLNGRIARSCKHGTGDSRCFENSDHGEQSFPAEEAQCSAWEVYFLAYPNAGCELHI